MSHALPEQCPGGQATQRSYTTHARTVATALRPSRTHQEPGLMGLPLSLTEAAAVHKAAHRHHHGQAHASQRQPPCEEIRAGAAQRPHDAACIADDDPSLRSDGRGRRHRATHVHLRQLLPRRRVEDVDLLRSLSMAVCGEVGDPAAQHTPLHGVAPIRRQHTARYCRALT